MTRTAGIRVIVEGDLPAEAMTEVSTAVRTAVLDVLARLDLAPALREVPFPLKDSSTDDEPRGGPGVLDEIQPFGIWLKPPPDPTAPLIDEL
jgi:hypothetical protein